MTNATSNEQEIEVIRAKLLLGEEVYVRSNISIHPSPYPDTNVDVNEQGLAYYRFKNVDELIRGYFHQEDGILVQISERLDCDEDELGTIEIQEDHFNELLEGECIAKVPVNGGDFDIIKFFDKTNKDREIDKDEDGTSVYSTFSKPTLYRA